MCKSIPPPIDITLINIHAPPLFMSSKTKSIDTHTHSHYTLTTRTQFDRFDPKEGRISERDFAKMILSYADINDQQKKKYMKRVKRAYEDGKVRERDTDLYCATRFCVYALHLSKQDTFSHPKYHSCMHFSL